MVMTWQRWAHVRDWNLRTVSVPFGIGQTPRSEQEVFDTITAAVTPATRVLFLYHVSSPTGLVFPLRELCAFARERDILTVIDGAHGPGMLPCDLTEIGADYYASNLHKWLMCPSAGGFLHVASHRRNDLRALITSWGWGYERSRAFEDSGNGGSRWQWDLEFHGTADRTPQMVVPDALAFRRLLGSDEQILAHLRSLAAYARHIVPLPCATPADERLTSALTVFEVPECDPVATRDRLYRDFGIECPITLSGGRCFLRVSTAVFTRREHLDALAAAVRSIWKT
jgi:isopenicillin-N epimerase